jgi:rubredoxin
VGATRIRSGLCIAQSDHTRVYAILAAADGVTMKKWMCVNCGYTYDEALGDPANGLAPGTRWEDIPQDWICPDCGMAKADFEMVEQ